MRPVSRGLFESARRAETVQRVIAFSLTVLGAYYLLRSLVTLVTLRSTTWRWIALSGDPDFKWDYGLFFLCIGLGAVFVFLLGVATTSAGILTVSGRMDNAWHWKALAFAAPLIHFAWFMYRVVGASGNPTRVHLFAVRCAVICFSYLLLWALTRRTTNRHAVA